MPDLGPHAIFILAAYAVTFVAVAALALAIVADDRKQRRLLADLEQRGIRRRSANAPAKLDARKAGKPPRRRL
jgi:heme exporter protein D